ncbi:MAG: hypothetical protein IJW08_09830, partial [Lentisphaeria bacterium]|nr:hypothetical protein [Lentisphaeria bacterium]
ENFFSREKKFSLSPRAPLSLSRKAGNFFIHLYLPVSGTEPSRKAGKLFYLPLPSRVGNRAKKINLYFRKISKCQKLNSKREKFLLTELLNR